MEFIKNKSVYWIGLAIVIAAFLFLIFREEIHHGISVAYIAIGIAGAVVGGIILMSFSMEKKTA